MDVYSITFTLPRNAASGPFGTANSPATHLQSSSQSLLSPGSTSEASLNLPSPIGSAAPRQSAPGPSTGRLQSMRSRFPPSVKAFMPSAFGGSKRASERIAEAVGPGSEKSEGEGEDQDSSAPGAIGEGLKMEKSASKDSVKPSQSVDSRPTAGSPSQSYQPGVKENTELAEHAAAEATKSADDSTVPKPTAADLAQSGKLRDSRSTVDTHSSLDFGSRGSVSAESVSGSAVAGAGAFGTPGGTSTRATSEFIPSATHSAQPSLSTSGIGPQPTGAELSDAIARLATDAMNVHQCLIAVSPVELDDGAGGASSRNLRQRQSSFSNPGSSPFPSQPLPAPASSPFPSTYPYQQYAQGFGHDMASAFPSRMGMGVGPAGGMLGVASPYSSIPMGSSASLASQHSLQAAPLTMQIPPSQPPRPTIQHYSFHLSGGYAQVMSARGAILRDAPFRARSVLKVPRGDIVHNAADQHAGGTPTLSQQPSVGQATETLKPHARSRLDTISAQTRTHVSWTSTEPRGRDLGYGLETERSVELAITGSFEGVEQARVRIMVMLDELNGLHTEMCEIDYKLHNIIGGRKRCVIQKIQEETATNIYLPTSFSNILSTVTDSNPDFLARQNTIYVTGDFFGAQRARDMLYQVSVHKSKGIISRDTAVLPRKVDWMLMERLEELKSAMLDNGTFINFPMLGGQASVISVFGDNRVSIERTIRSVMSLTSQFYTASLWLLPLAYDAFSQTAMLDSAQLALALKDISSTSGAEIVFKGNCFEMHGLENEVRAAVSSLLDLKAVRPYNFEVRFQIELANDQREFISGKKNGKVNKIMKQCGVRIKFDAFNDYNFLIEVSSNDRTGALQGLAFLQEELPAEISFHVPEAYHKRIIGVGGKSIQRIMKKYGVYVKFSNAEEFAALGGYVDNEDNVVARTPAKNAINLENLKQAVMELVNPKDKDYTSETVAIARRYHRTLLGEKGTFIHDIETKTSSTVRFPPKETASDLVSIFGPESQIHIAAQMLLDHVPFEAEFRTPHSAELAQLVSAHEFVALTERVKRDLNITIVPVVGTSKMDGAASSSAIAPPSFAGTETLFKFRLNRSNADFLPAAKDALEDFLVSRNINVYDSPKRTRSDSFASSFPHFATKLISTATESTDSFQTDILRYQYNNDRSRLRTAASTPDIKALFDTPSHYSTPGSASVVSHGHHYTTSALPGSGSSMPAMMGFTPRNQPSNSPMLPSSMYPSPYAESPIASAPAPFSSDVWAPPQVSPAHASGAGIAFPHHTTRMSDDVGLIHRNNDPLSEEARRSALRKPRSFAHRAQPNHRTQSLDIGALASQQAAQAVASGSVPRPYGAIGSNSGFMPSVGTQMPPAGGGFAPSHASTSSISRVAPSATRGPVPEPATMDEVSRVLSQLAFDRH
ncbi:Vigilin [Ceraceosorus bombacis]|uniref:Vigilin n=1 Tax=Ceraceosorus bombacis TaxID=401625 RepID=A0A0N7L9N6_9BASI|nr:Vigilin [Ceraceosorus bombacis]